jgi:DUF1707 SHOCT-like domain/2TM domain
VLASPKRTATGATLARMADPAQRASDEEREAVAERLRTAAAEGRLDADELEERLGAAYGAKTVGDLVPLTGDLPTAPAAAPASPAPLSGWRSQHLRQRLATFIVVNVVCIVVWLATGGPSDGGGFWPGWVLLGTGIGLFSMLVRTAFGVEEQPRRDRRRLERTRVERPDG